MEPSRENPFPGMNPYLEGGWPDVHTRLVAEIGNLLGADLPQGLVARVEEAVAVDDISGVDESRYKADTAVVEKESWRYGTPPAWSPEAHSGADGLVATEPEIFSVEEATERWVEIRTTEGKVVTVIEIISPSNREGIGRDRYLKKQISCLASDASLVEIDLIRRGQPVIAVPQERLLRREGTHGFVSVRRTLSKWRCELYPCPLKERLPVIAIPLRPGDKDIPIDLQPLVDRCYRLGGYWQTDFRKDPIPPLPKDELAWVDECLREAGLRD